MKRSTIAAALALFAWLPGCSHTQARERLKQACYADCDAQRVPQGCGVDEAQTRLCRETCENNAVAYAGACLAQEQAVYDCERAHGFVCRDGHLGAEGCEHERDVAASCEVGRGK